MIRKIFTNSRGHLFFNIFLFLLVSMPTISSIFLIFALISSTINRSDKYFEDKFNFFFFITGISLVIISLLQTFSASSNLIVDWSISNTWLGLANWIPYFFLVWASQPYLNTYESRRKASILLISGSIPLIASIFGQYWFKWNGPFYLLNGLIVWFQRPITGDFGASGLFNNQNYTSVWLLMLLPLSFALLRESRNFKLNKFIILSFTSCILISLYLTKSRSGWIGTLIASLLMVKTKYLFILIPLFLLVLFFLFIALVPILPNYQQYALNLFPAKILSRFQVIGFSELNYPRYLIWRKSFELICEKPFIGWGAASFPILYESSFKNNWRGHSHNIFLEIGQNYGIFPLMILLIIFMIILIKSFKIIYLKLFVKERKILNENFLFDNAWWSSSFLIFITQLFDIQYFDFRIGTIFWVLFAGLISLIKVEENNFKRC